MDISLLAKLLRCPFCRHDLSRRDSFFSCKNDHHFRTEGNLIDFSAASALTEVQEWSKRSFEDEWCRYYPRLGWQSRELASETEMFLTYTRAMPSFFFDKIVVDAGCGNGRYINVVNTMCSTRPRLLIGIELSDTAFLAARNCAEFENTVIFKMDLNDLSTVLKEPVDYIYSIGVLHHTPDAAGAFRNLAKCTSENGFLSLFLYGKGNPILYKVNSYLRNKLFSKWPNKLVYWICVALAVPCQIFKIKLIGGWLSDLVNRFVFVSSDVANMFDAYTAGWTSFHDKNEVEQWYRTSKYDYVVVSANNYTSLFCIGRRLR